MLNISTIEDPVEKNVPGINQTQVNPPAGLTFEVGLRALLRQDPDVIMVGETRDRETAEISVRAAITGHVVLSTLHTNDAASSIVRLEDMGVENYLVANSLVGMVAQRLMRKVCTNCAQEMETSAEERRFLGEDVKQVRRGRGCNQCNHTGYRGRIAAAAADQPPGFHGRDHELCQRTPADAHPEGKRGQAGKRGRDDAGRADEDCVRVRASAFGLPGDAGTFTPGIRLSLLAVSLA